MARKDSNTPATVQQKTAIAGDRAADSGAVLGDSAFRELALSRLVERWPMLNAAIREQIMALADGAL